MCTFPEYFFCPFWASNALRSTLFFRFFRFPEKYALPEVYENYAQKMRVFFINDTESITREKGFVNRVFKKICDFSKKIFMNTVFLLGKRHFICDLLT